jgi:DNA-binding transcriptional MerR regulator
VQSLIKSYKIRQVIELTGVNEFLLRIWEDRYLAFTPARTITGRRLYSENDILRARALLTLTQKGIRIGDIARLSLAKLNRMAEQNVTTEKTAETDSKVNEIISSANQFAWQEVRSLVLKEKEKRKPLDWVHDVIVPMVIEMGRQVDLGHFTIAQEHILSAIIKENLAFHFKRKSPLKRGIRIVLAAPEGDYHDLGLMIASHIATELRSNTLFVGANMPKNDLAAVCVRYQATHLMLSSTSSKEDGAKDDYLKVLNFLDRNLNQKVTIWLAGRNSQKFSISLMRPFKIFNSFRSFEDEIKKWRY